MGLLESIGMGMNAKKKFRTKEQLACRLCTLTKEIDNLKDEQCAVITHNHGYDYSYWGHGDHGATRYQISISTKDKDEIESLSVVINGWIAKNNTPKIINRQNELLDIQSKLAKLL